MLPASRAPHPARWRVAGACPAPRVGQWRPVGGAPLWRFSGPRGLGTAGSSGLRAQATGDDVPRSRRDPVAEAGAEGAEEWSPAVAPFRLNVSRGSLPGQLGRAGPGWSSPPLPQGPVWSVLLLHRRSTDSVVQCPGSGLPFAPGTGMLHLSPPVSRHQTRKQCLT